MFCFKSKKVQEPKRLSTRKEVEAETLSVSGDNLPVANYQKIFSGRSCCRCRKPRKPNWYINNVGGLYDTTNESKEVPLKKSHLDARVFNSTASIDYTQMFKNDQKSPIEVIYKFPIDKFFSVTGVKIKLDDKQINAVIMEKEEAKEKYDDAVAQGNTAAKINYDENIPEVLELAIGAIQPKKTVEICVEMAAKCDITKHGFYSFIFPMNFIPGIITSSYGKNNMKRNIPGEFSANIVVEASSTISDLSVSHSEMVHEQDDSGNRVTIALKESSSINSKDIVVSFSTPEIRKPQITLQTSDKHPEEVLAHITCIPRISDEEEVAEEEIPSEDDEAAKTSGEDEFDIASGEFIFVIDRSGSMGGSRIKIAKDALKLFIQSLPSVSKFNIVGFGTRLDIMYPESVPYSKENIDDALAKIEMMKADLGGTNLSEPLDEIYDMPTDYKYPRSIFVLTDGQIFDTEQVMKKVRSHNNFGRVHSFGIGGGASKYLVNELAKAGLGTSTLIEDNDSNTKAKVIAALNQAARPALTNIQMNWGRNSEAVKFEVPREPIFGFIYEEEILDVYAVLNKVDLVHEEITLSFFNTFDQETEEIIFAVNPDEIIDKENNDVGFKLAARDNMVHYERLKSQKVYKADNSSIQKEVTALSLKYSVLSEHTAFFGKIKNKTKSGEELKTIEIPIKKMEENDFYDGYGSCMAIKSSMPLARRSSPGIFNKVGSAIGGMFGGGSGAKKSMKSKGAPRMLARCAAPRAPKMMMDCNVMCAAPEASMRNISDSSDSDDYVMEKCLGSSDSNFSRKEMNKESRSRKKKSKKSKNNELMAYTPAKNLEGYEKLIQFQDPDGHFTDLSSEYSHLLSNSPPEDLESLVKNDSMIDEIWTTILAVLILETHFKSSKGEWVMIAKKARSFLKKSLQKGSDIDQYLSYIS
ncbi:unnamed protein product [Moneuplotes crassus]|uniref:Uncharacterized protein n=1 Tax=Euplotes crassus TaxID=5936 RepID=A0AAD1XMK3_EUPCR|nr:unnamed protein product [Moneuplotes crassus]